MRRPTWRPLARQRPAGFRPELQALRALGIGLVLVYHLWPDRLTGGFVGVDVFFVISGFLISSHLLREAEATGGIALGRFYARRIRRLLPAALLVLLVTAVAAAIWLPASALRQTANELIASALYVQNWVLAANSVDYLMLDSARTVAQHYWSLSVEEQFYLVWPLLMLLALAIAGTRLRARTALGWMFGLVFAASLAFSIVETARSPESAYFVTPTRGWEFAAGGLVALALTSPRLGALFAPDRGSRLQVVFGWLGLGLIGAAAVLFDSGTAFPGVAALLPVVGAVLVILGATPASRLSTQVLAGLPPVQFAGRISYSVYLWHWPLILLYPAITGTQSGAGIVVIAASLGLGALTTFLVEDPLRRGRLSAAPVSRTMLAAAAAMAVVVAVCAGQLAYLGAQKTDYSSAVAQVLDGPCAGAAAMDPANDCPSPFAVTDTVRPEHAKDDRADPGECQQSKYRDEIVTCDFGDLTDPRGVIALVGDSHAEQLAFVLDDWARDNGLLVRTYAKSACPLTLVNRTNISANCLIWTESVIDTVTADPNVELVVYTSRPSGYIDGVEPDERFTAADLEISLERLRDGGKQVVLVRDVPGTDAVGLDCLEQSDDLVDPCPTPRSQVITDDAITMSAASLGLPLIDLTEWFCDAQSCHFVIGGLIVYGDGGGHLTQAFARTLGPYLAAELEPQLR